MKELIGLWEKFEELTGYNLSFIEKKIGKKIRRLMSKQRIFNLKELFSITERELQKTLRGLKIDNEIPLNFIDIKGLALQILFSIFGLKKLAPLLVDADVEEIYIDGAEKPLYFDHKNIGRVKANVVLTEDEIERFIFFLKFFTNLFTTSTKPSDKVEIDLGELKIRISVDAPPLVQDYSIIIRKQHAEVTNLNNLFKYNSLEAIFLLLILAIAKSNILILGEPGSGKTFLSTVLLRLVPGYWRLILIEDTKEVNLHREYGLIRYKVNPFETRIIDEFNKEKQILKALHRSPDYLFVGEIHDKSDAEAFFHGLASGLHILATSHALSIDEFLDRMENSFKVDRNRLCMLDALVFMNKKITMQRNERYIDSIFLSSKMFAIDICNKLSTTNFNYSRRLVLSDKCCFIEIFTKRAKGEQKGSPKDIALIVLRDRVSLGRERDLKVLIDDIYNTLQSIKEAKTNLIEAQLKITKTIAKLDELLIY